MLLDALDHNDIFLHIWEFFGMSGWWCMSGNWVSITELSINQMIMMWIAYNSAEWWTWELLLCLGLKGTFLYGGQIRNNIGGATLISAIMLYPNAASKHICIGSAQLASHWNIYRKQDPQHSELGNTHDSNHSVAPGYCCASSFLPLHISWNTVSLSQSVSQMMRFV